MGFRENHMPDFRLVSTSIRHIEGRHDQRGTPDQALAAKYVLGGDVAGG
jgi:hypothetical protein